MLKGSLITPYRGERYHLKEYSRNPPRNLQELFNLRHASLRNTIERAFGVLKRRFPIIASATEPNYGIQTQKEIILACCILHNYLWSVDPDVSDFSEVQEELDNATATTIIEPNYNDPDDTEDAHRGEMLRDMIAVGMWQNYNM